jgi:arylsulfatase
MSARTLKSLIAATAVCAGSVFAQQSAIDRTVLPIKEPRYKPITELDARDAKAPPRFEVKAPSGGP